MIFTSTPETGASIYGPLLYTFADEEAPRDLTVEVIDNTTRQIIFTKRLYNTSSGQIDISPLLQRRLKWRPAATPAGFSSAGERTAFIQVRVEGVSVSRRFYPSSEPLEENKLLLSSMPTNRLLARGECEELLLPAGILRAEVERFTPEGSITEEFISEYALEPALFGLKSEGWESDVYRAELRLYGAEQMLTLHYTLTEPLPEGVRVAWVGRQGSIEHYTFPVCLKRSESQHLNHERLTTGEHLTLQAAYEEQWQLLSAYESSARLAALAELGTAPAAWIITPDGEYRSVAVAEGERILRRYGYLSALEFTLTTTPQQQTLWS